MWNKSISLLRKQKSNQDEAGFIEDEIFRKEHIPANFQDVTRNDEILAAQKGYSVDQNVEIMACNYNGERYLIDESTEEIFDIRRTFRKDKSMKITLSCERRTNGEI